MLYPIPVRNPAMKRRYFLQTAGLAALGSSPLAAGKQIHWKMVTAWPKNFPGLGTSAERLAQRIEQMSGGRLVVKVYAAGELVPAFEVFDTVAKGTAEIGHAAAHYWTGKILASQFFGGVPFGLTANEMNAWLYYGGGLELWREVYAPYGLIPMPAGNAGVQMGGWYKKEIESLNDLKGLKVRIAGLGGEVLRRAGATPVTTPVSEIFTALQSGTIDATEFIGPYTDLTLGLYKAAKYYYYPGWHEPGSTLECLLNQEAFNKLPEELKTVVSTACQAINLELLAELTARNAFALQTLVNDHQVVLRHFPEEVVEVLRSHAGEMLAELAEKDATSRKVYLAYDSFHQQVGEWTKISEYEYLKARYSES